MLGGLYLLHTYPLLRVCSARQLCPAWGWCMAEVQDRWRRLCIPLGSGCGASTCAPGTWRLSEELDLVFTEHTKVAHNKLTHKFIRCNYSE